MNTGDGSSYPGRYESLEQDAVIPTPLPHNLTRTRAPKAVLARLHREYAWLFT